MTVDKKLFKPIQLLVCEGEDRYEITIFSQVIQEESLHSFLLSLSVMDMDELSWDLHTL